jgi:hypothetical protein
VESRRTRDRLLGAAVGVLLGVLLVVLVAVVLVWRVSEPASGSAAPAGPPAAPGADHREGVDPPGGLRPGQTWLSDVVLDADTVVTPDARLRDVRAVGQDVRTGPGGARAGTLAVDATVPFDVVAREIGPGTTVSAAGRDRATVVRTVELAGRQLRVVATGTVTVVSGRLVVEPLSIDIGGPGVLADAIAGVVRGLVTIEHTVEGLPEGLVLRDVTVRDDGFRAALQGQGVLLAR